MRRRRARREAERKAREALTAQRREERNVARQARLLSHKCRSNIHCTCSVVPRLHAPSHGKDGPARPGESLVAPGLAHQGKFLGLKSGHKTSVTKQCSNLLIEQIESVCETHACLHNASLQLAQRLLS